MLSRDKSNEYLEKRRARAAAGPDRDVKLPCQAYPLLFVSDDTREWRTAASLCEHCPIRQTCDDLAHEVRPVLGVWAGRLWDNGRPLRGRATT